MSKKSFLDEVGGTTSLEAFADNDRAQARLLAERARAEQERLSRFRARGGDPKLVEEGQRGVVAMVSDIGSRGGYRG